MIKPRRRLSQLTDEQITQLREHARSWVSRVVSTAPVDQAKFEGAARQCYAHAGIPWPGRVIWTSSPLAMVLAAPAAAFVLQLCRQGFRDVPGAASTALRAAVGEEIVDVHQELLGLALTAALNLRVQVAVKRVCLQVTREEISRDVGALVAQHVRLAMRRTIDERVSRQVGDAVSQAAESAQGSPGAVHQLLAAVIEEAGRGAGYVRREGEIRQAVGAVIDQGLAQCLCGESWLGEHTLGRPDVTSFMRETCGLRLEPELWARARALEQTVLSAGWWYPHRDFVMACGRPIGIHLEQARNAAGARFLRLHRPDGPAVEWPDGWGIHAVHGRWLPGWIIDHPERITVLDIERQRNAEIRRVMLERYGWARYITHCGARIMDEVSMDHRIAGLRGSRLLRKELNGEPEPIVYLEMRNSTPEPDGSHRRYLERIDPKIYDGDAGRLCHAAMASRWRYRDNDGVLQLTFGDWRDYEPTGES